MQTMQCKANHQTVHQRQTNPISFLSQSSFLPLDLSSIDYWHDGLVIIIIWIPVDLSDFTPYLLYLTKY